MKAVDPAGALHRVRAQTTDEAPGGIKQNLASRPLTDLASEIDEYAKSYKKPRPSCPYFIPPDLTA
jgi:hypothetical protein